MNDLTNAERRRLIKEIDAIHVKLNTAGRQKAKGNDFTIGNLKKRRDEILFLLNPANFN